MEAYRYLADPTLLSAEVYKAYVDFQTKMQNDAVVTSLTESGRAHYRNVFRPKTREQWETMIQRMGPLELEHLIRTWKAGFEVWLADRERERAERWGKPQKELE